MKLAALIPSWHQGIDKNPDGSLNIKGLGDAITVLANVVQILLFAAGLLAGIFIILGGIFYIASLDDPQRKAKAKETIFYAVTGLVISMSAYGIVKFITGTVF